MKKIKLPQSQTEEVLYYLINRIQIDRKQMMLSCNVLNLPEQISRLRRRYGLKIDLKEVSVTNKFGRVTDFGYYYITDKKKASLIYEEMQLKNHNHGKIQNIHG